MVEGDDTKGDDAICKVVDNCKGTLSRKSSFQGDGVRFKVVDNCKELSIWDLYDQRV